MWFGGGSLFIARYPHSEEFFHNPCSQDTNSEYAGTLYTSFVGDVGVDV